MNGLTTARAKELLKQYGLNVIEEQKKKNILIKFFEQFNNFLTILLIIAAFLSFFIGEPVDGGLILAIVILNAFFGLYQEAKAEESIAALKQMTLTRVRVIRDGGEIEIDSRYLVPGDVVHIEEGVKISADGKIIESINLEVNEASLTGESLPVSKNLKDDIFSGTLVAKGRGLMEVAQTGMATKFGQIAANLSLIEEGPTPLQKKLAGLTKTIGIIGIIAAIIVFILSFLQGATYFPAFLLSISLAVAVVPEGLPAVMTITLAIGVKEMAKKKSIIRKLSAIEALGSVTLIATDKTGTLTTNKMTVKEIYVDEKVYLDTIPSLANHAFAYLVLNGILCSTASLVYVHDHGRWDVLGDPTEGSLLFLAQKVGLLPEMVRAEWQLIQEIPFDGVTKKMTVTVQKKDEVVAFTKGAPESILAGSQKILKGRKEAVLDLKGKEKIEEQVERWASKGLRVLAFAYKDMGPVGNFPPVSAHLGGSLSDIGSVKDYTDNNTQSESKPSTALRAAGSPSISDTHSNNNNLVFLGMVAIHDAPRLEVVEAVTRAQEAGIRVVMITGDNEKTAEAIGVTTGIIQAGDEILTGQQLDSFSDVNLLKILPKVKIFARTNPFQKHRIVKLYQKLNEVVAVTGDGVNDAIALKQADVGVAMGLVGTDVARETADMVITDDNFASIVNAVEEGRNIIKNLKNAIQYLLSCNVSEAIALIGGLLLGFPNLFYPIQFLYINLITDGFPALSLAFSPRSAHLTKASPEKEQTLLKSSEKIYIFLVGIISTILVLGSFFLFSKYVSITVGRTAVFSVLTLIQSFILIDLWLSHQSMHKNIKHLISPLFLTAFAFPFILQYVVVRFSFTASLFKIQPVSLFTYLQFVILSGLVMVGIKIVKKILRYG